MEPVLHHDAARALLYLASTSKSSNFDTMAKAVGATRQIAGEQMFRALGRIGRLVFNNLGVTKHGRRNLSYAMYTGANVREALSEAEKRGSRKSNISGYGWEKGKQITIGCSYKGRVWSKAAGTIPLFIRWAEQVGDKLIDTSIDTKSIIANVLIPEFAETLPDYEIVNIDWPVELYRNAEDRITIQAQGLSHDWLEVGIEWQAIDRDAKQIDFAIVIGDEFEPLAEFSLFVRGVDGYDVVERTKALPTLHIGSNEIALAEFFKNYPPLVRFVDLSELDGNILLKAEDAGIVPLPQDR